MNHRNPLAFTISERVDIYTMKLKTHLTRIILIPETELENQLLAKWDKMEATKHSGVLHCAPHDLGFTTASVGELEIHFHEKKD